MKDMLENHGSPNELSQTAGDSWVDLVGTDPLSALVDSNVLTRVFAHSLATKQPEVLITTRVRELALPSVRIDPTVSSPDLSAMKRDETQISQLQSGRKHCHGSAALTSCCSSAGSACLGNSTDFLAAMDVAQSSKHVFDADSGRVQSTCKAEPKASRGAAPFFSTGLAQANGAKGEEPFLSRMLNSAQEEVTHLAEQHGSRKRHTYTGLISLPSTIGEVHNRLWPIGQTDSGAPVSLPSGSTVAPGFAGGGAIVPPPTRSVIPLGVPILGAALQTTNGFETSATSVPAGSSPTHPNGALVITAYSFDEMRRSGASASGAIWISNGLNPTRLEEFRRFSAAQIMDGIPGLNLPNPPPPALPNTRAGWFTSGDLYAATGSPADVPLSSARRILVCALLSRTRVPPGGSALEPTDTDAVIVFRTDDFGNSWNYSVVAPVPEAKGSVAFVYDQPQIIVHPRHANRVYVLAHELRGGVIAVSNDGGATFSPFRPMMANGMPMTGVFFTARVNVAADVLVVVWQRGDGVMIDSEFVDCDSMRIPRGATQNVTWWVAWTSDQTGVDWSQPMMITSGPSRCKATAGTDAEYLGVRNGRRRCGFVVAANGHGVVAVTQYVPALDSEQVHVFESADCRTWNLALRVPVGANDSDRNRDQFLPMLTRNDYDRYDPHVVLAWYDTRESGDGTEAAVYSISSDSHGTAGTWGDRDAATFRTRVLSGRLSGGPARIRNSLGITLGKIGEYWGLTSFVRGGEVLYLFAWMWPGPLDPTNRLPYSVVQARIGRVVDP